MKKLPKFPTREELATALRNKRVRHGLHKYQIAKIVGVSVATLTRVEDRKSHSSMTNYLIRNWVNKKGIL
jgi:transcriptional regulator with XRE-family HTH domain